MRQILPVLLLLSSAACAWAGRSGFTFLNSPPAAAPASMAGAVAGATGKPWSVFYNPAGLARLDRASLSLHGQSAWEDVLHESVSYARPRGRRDAWALTAGIFAVQGLVKTRYDPASPDHFTESGSLRAGDQYLGAAYGRRISPEWDAGAAVKLLKEDLDDRSAWTAALDLGVAREVDDRWGWGAAVRNLGPGAKLSSEKFSTPLRAQAGAYYKTESWMEWGLDYVHGFKDGGDEILGGVQFDWQKTAFLRAGYRHLFKENGLGALSGATAGLGGRWGSLEADYAFQPFGDLGGAHRVSLSWQFGKPRLNENHRVRRRSRVRLD